jgi:hypothetical protein
MATASPKTPNLYQVQGRQVHVTYSTTSIDGKPHFTYQDRHQTLTFEGDAIRTLDSEIGALVTVSLVRTVDTGSTSFTLVVPHVNLGQAAQVPITTQGITTLHRLSPVPVLNEGQSEISTTVRLTGTASAVNF